jgi:hypothetical protein
MKKLAITCGLITILFSAANGQNADALRVLSSALKTLGGETKIKSYSARWNISRKFWSSASPRKVEENFA